MKSLLAIATLAAAFSTAAFAADMTDVEIDLVTLTDVTDLTPGEHEISIDLLPNKANGVSGAVGCLGTDAGACTNHGVSIAIQKTDKQVTRGQRSR